MCAGSCRKIYKNSTKYNGLRNSYPIWRKSRIRRSSQVGRIHRRRSLPKHLAGNPPKGGIRRQKLKDVSGYCGRAVPVSLKGRVTRTTGMMSGEIDALYIYDELQFVMPPDLYLCNYPWLTLGPPLLAILLSNRSIAPVRPPPRRSCRSIKLIRLHARPSSIYPMPYLR